MFLGQDLSLFVKFTFCGLLFLILFDLLFSQFLGEITLFVFSFLLLGFALFNIVKSLAERRCYGFHIVQARDQTFHDLLILCVQNDVRID